MFVWRAPRCCPPSPQGCGWMFSTLVWGRESSLGSQSPRAAFSGSTSCRVSQCLASTGVAPSQRCLLQQTVPSGSANPWLLSCVWGSERTPHVTVL